MMNLPVDPEWLWLIGGVVLLIAELIAPGVVPVEEWRPVSDLDFNSLPTAMWGGVGRRR